MPSKIAQMIVMLLVVPLFAEAAETRFLQGLGDTQYHLSHAKEIGRDFHIYVMLPDGYEDSESDYPTAYLLDGGNLFPMLTPYYRYLSFGENIPAMIIVGISYGSENFEDGNFRSTDYTAPSDERENWGGAAKFQDYLEKELLPLVEDRYRSNPEERIVFGQSLGGQFVIYSALTKPNLFQGHIASNPAMHRNLPFFLESHAEQSGLTEPSKLFIGSASNDDLRFGEPRARWIDHWQSIADKPWHLKVANLEGHSHMSAPPASFRLGMHWLFSD